MHIDDRNILTCKAFVDKRKSVYFQYYFSSYKPTISKYLTQEKDRLIQDCDRWKRSSDSKLHWLKKFHTSIQLNTYVTHFFIQCFIQIIINRVSIKILMVI
ncbi:hypothetical protein BY458DRAFT_292468 [Sporodiniella umbellata]|nr:hypothetical protein BY458DRAFT_292468 [Sporodiniella umbellata]